MISTSRLVTLLLLVSLILIAPIISWGILSFDYAQGMNQVDQSSSLIFIENVGQFSPGARYLLRTGTSCTWLGKNSIWVTTSEPEAADPDREQLFLGDRSKLPETLRGLNIRLSFVGANPTPLMEAFSPRTTSISYLMGDDPTNWHTTVPVWGGVRYHDLYPGIDLVLDTGMVQSAGEGLPWRLEMDEAADINQVRLQVEGAQNVLFDGSSLVLDTEIGSIVIPGLLVSSGRSDEQPFLNHDGLSTSVELVSPGVHQVTTPLVFEPQTVESSSVQIADDLLYSTFLGGGSWDAGYGVEVNDAGEAFVVGRTPSTDFPTTPGAFNILAEQIDGFVVKLDQAGSNLVYATFLGGAGFDSIYDLAIVSGNAYLTGDTNSSDFPTTPDAHDPTCGSDGTCDAGGQGPYTDAFYTQLNADGTDLLYSTYIGGSKDDTGYGIAVEGGNVYLTGITDSTDFLGQEQNGDGDVFGVSFNNTGGLNYATLIGGGDVDAGYSIASLNGYAYITGETSSNDFPASGYAGGRDVFVSKLNPDGSTADNRLYGGIADDIGNAIGVSAAGNIYASGSTKSSDFPVTQGLYNGGSADAFVQKISSSFTVVYSAFLGGLEFDEASALSLDDAENIYLSGSTASGDFPVTTDAYQPTYAGNIDAFVAQINLNDPAPEHLSYASYLGGINADRAYGIDVGPSSYSYLTGYTASSNFPTTSGAFDQVLSGSQDAFVTIIAASPIPAVDIEKHTNGQDADDPPGIYLQVNSTVNWTYLVTNTGNTDLVNIVVSDSKDITVNCPSTNLSKGESMTCTASGTALLGQYDNIGTASAEDSFGTQASDSDPSHYHGSNPQISLVKKINDQDANSPPGVYLLVGDPITWTYQVANGGNVDLTNVTVVDDNGTPSNGADDFTVCIIAALPVGDTQTCSISGTATPGQYVNTATATGAPPADLVAVSDSDASHYFGADPLLDLEKRTNGEDADASPGPYVLVGDTVTWTYEAINQGNTDLTNVTIVDDSGTPGDAVDDVTVCVIDTLNVGESQTCTLSGTVFIGQYSNQAQGTAFVPVGPNISASDPSHYFGIDPVITLQKSTNAQDADVAPGPYILVGDLVSWTYQVSNQGNVELADVIVSDDNGTPSDPADDFTVCTFPSLAVDETQICTIDSSATSGQYGNLATASGTPPVGPDASDSDPSHYFGSQPGISLQKRTNDQDADNAPGPYILSGDTVTWEYQVSNTGNVELSAVTVTDDNGTPTNPNDDVTICTIASLGAGTSQTCTRSGTAVVGQYANLGSISGTPPVGADVSDSDPSHYFGTSPDISLQKTTNGEDADSAPGPYILIGEPVSWEYQVSNTGNVELTVISITDDNGTPGDPADDFTVCTFPSLAAGETQTCTRDGSASAGQYANLGTASGTPPVGPGVSHSDSSHYYGATTSISLVKKTNGQDADSAPGPYILVGNSVNWAYDITNTGEVDLSNVTITDDNGTPGDPADDITVCTITTLSVGATRSCTRSGTSTAGQYANLGSVSSFYGATEISASDASHYFGADLQISIEKHTNDQDADSAPGPYVLVDDPLSWSYQVSNQGNVDLSNVTVTDDNGTPSNTGDDITVCTIPSLAAGADQICSHAGTAVAGQYANQGRVKGTPPGGLADISHSDPSHYFGADPLITLQKTTNDQDADSAPGPYILVGDPVSWSYEVSNQGNVALSDVSITDDNGTPSDPADDFTVCTFPNLAIGETQNCSSSGTTISGQYANQGTANGTPPGGLSDINDMDPSHYFGSQPALSLVKKTNGQDANEPPGPGILEGDAVEWTYEVSNTGNVSLSNLVVVDDNGTPSDLTDDRTICMLASLAVAGSDTCSDSGLAAVGQYENNATVTGKPPGGLAEVSGSDNSHYFGESPSISIDKKTNGQDADNPPGPTILVGNPVDWTYNVTNDGNVALSEITVTDDNGTPSNPADDITVCNLTNLEAGASQTCNLSDTAQEGQYANVATVTSTPPQGPQVSDSDPSHYYGAPPGIRIIKYTNGEDANDPPGPYLSIDDPVNWTYEVINTGEVNMLDITVTDDNGTPDNPDDDITVCSLASLAPSASETCLLDSTAQEGQYTNIATASGTPQGGSTLSASDASHYFGVSPAINLVKKTNGEDANAAPGPYILTGDPVTWSYVVTNTGNVALSNVTVSDDNGTPSNAGDDVTVCVLDSLDADSSFTCTLSSTAVVGQYANVGTVTGTPPVGTDVSDSDASHYFGADVVLNLSKKTNDQDAESPPGPYILVGGTVDWIYEISNDGNVDLTDITITDDNGTPDNDTDDVTVCTISSLTVGASDRCSHSGIAVTGQYENQALATGTPPGGLESITMTDVSHYFGADPQATIEKKTNNQDADAASGPYILVGDAVSWTYEVKNTGNESLSGVTVIDDSGTPGNPADDVTVCTIAELGAGVTQNCSQSGTAGTGQYGNIATVTGASLGGLADVSSSDPSHYFGADPLIDLVKKTNGLDANETPGPSINVDDAVNWDYEVTNSGNVSLSDIRVTDDQGVVINCPQSSLDVGEKITCTASGIAVLGQYTNNGTALGTPPGGLDDVSDSDPSHYFGSNPSLLVVKKTNGEEANQPPGPYIQVGDDVDWTYVVTNSGNVDITDVEVSDDNGTPSNTEDDFTVCTIASLPVDGSEQCTWSGTAIEGQYANTATVTGTTTDSSQASDTDISHYFGSQPNVSLQKQTNGEDADTAPGPAILVGETVTWTYEVSNAGNVALSNVTITDDSGTPSDPSDDVTVCIISSLLASSDESCTRTGTAVAGQYANEGTVTANPPGSLSSVSDSDPSHYFGTQPGIQLVKSTAGQDANEPPGPYILVGEPVTWAYEVTNIGNVNLDNVVVTDDNGTGENPADDFTVCTIPNLAAGSNQTCEYDGTANPGQYMNIGSASGTPTVGEDVVDSDMSHYFGADPVINLQKSTNGEDADSAPGPYILLGETVTWAYEVSNDGNVTMSDMTIIDDNGTSSNPSDDVEVCSFSELIPGATETCTYSGNATEGQYANNATASGSPPGTLDPVSSTDPSHYFGSRPGIEIVKKTNNEDANEPPGPSILVGDHVSWTYEVSNTGNLTVTNVIVTDDQEISVSCPNETLAPTETMVCSVSGVAENGQYSNIGTATGTLPGGLGKVSQSDPSHYLGYTNEPSVDIQKSTNGLDANNPPGPYLLVGEQVTWEYRVTNNGNVDLTNLVVVDDNGTPSNASDDVSVCQIPSLSQGTSSTCSLNGTAQEGQYANLATVTTDVSGGGQISDTDTSHYFGAAPLIRLVKKTNDFDANTPPGPYIPVGDSVEWLYEVYNDGNVNLGDVQVVDDNGTPANESDDIIVCTLPEIAQGSYGTCTLNSTATKGQYGNQASATGTPPGGLAVVTDQDVSHYFGATPSLLLIKKTNGEDANNPPGPAIPLGETVTWTYLVNNNGNVELTNLVITDDNGTPTDPADDFTVCTISNLDDGMSQTCIATAKAVESQYANIGTVIATPPGGLSNVSDADASHYFGESVDRKVYLPLIMR